ncbi:hypothetical protein BJF92_10255 [Rhizobium rhizosphaerae]|uniref:DUF3426 domain-containing protein n=1 Tax=Xaviernesmea rhizosphaerae TaxID=1672749 RepID=A0A1Q9AMA4_9HYPH|nr:hypothetical protein BJF92_10255 [Xaviernesmea rhizosphaerae]OQP87792.1 hypothetical protein BTR14_04355 [Xaviernesmea rhizosphaerae]
MATVVALAIVYGALRSSRFARLAEPVLSVLVAIVLVAAFLIWATGDQRSARDPQPPLRPSQRLAITPDQVQLDGLVFTQGTPINNFIVTGRMTNRSDAVLNYFTFVAALEDCAASPCRPIGEDHALVLARLPPQESRDLRLVLTLPLPAGPLSPALRWTTRVETINALPAGPAAPPVAEGR